MTEHGAARASRSASAVRNPIAVLYAALCLLFLSTFADSRARPCPAGLRCSKTPTVASALPPPPDAARGVSRLAIVVADAERRAVASAKITVLWLANGLAYLAGAATSDGEGRATVEALPGGEYFVLAEAEGRARASTRLLLGEADTRDLALILQPAHSLSVTVLNDRGSPIERAWVEVDSGDPLPFVGTTDTSGGGRIGRMGPPPYRVRAGAPGHESAAEWVTKGAAEPIRFALRPLGTIEVIVVDAEGAPAANATVAIVGSGLWPARMAKTDSVGRTQIPDLPAGAYNLRATAGDRVAMSEFGVRLERGQNRSVTLVLMPGRRLAARVVQGDGEVGGAEERARPLAGANVVLTEGGLSPFPVEGTTDERGRVVLGPISAAGEAYLSARADGFVAKNGVLVPRDAPPEIVISLVRGATLRGEVVDGRGFPVAGASIEVIGTAADGTPIDETPERNAFRAAHFTWALPGPRQLVRAGALGVMAGPIPPVPHDSWAAATALASPSGGAGRGIGGTRSLDFVRTAAPVEPWVTRSDGTFRARPIPPGRVRAIVRHPAYVETTSAFVTLPAAGEGMVHVIMAGGGRLEGRVLDEHRNPVSGARVELAALHGSLERSTTSAQDGTFAFASVPGEISLSVARPEALDEVALHALVTVRDAETKTIELVLPAERDAMTVHVSDEHGLPLAPVQILVSSLAPNAPLRKTLFTDRNGNAVFADVVGLPVRLQASMRGRAPVMRELGSAPTDLSLEMDAGTTVTGTITARSGREFVASAEVTLHVVTGALEARSNREGSYRLENVPLGQARIAVKAEGYVPVEKAVSIEANTRNDRPFELAPINLDEGGTVQGEVVDAHGDPVASARVGRGTVLSYVPASASSRTSGVVTDKAGLFQLTDLPEGQVTLEAYHHEKGRGKVTVEVRAGRVIDRVRIALAPDTESASTLARPEESATGGLALTLADRGKGEVVVVAVAPRSEAERAGIAPGDRIVAIDGEPVDTMATARDRMFGPVADDVVVEILREGANRRLRVARERVRQ